MKHFLILMAIVLAMSNWSCQKDEINTDENSDAKVSLKSWQTLLDGNSFSTRANLEANWKYLYPWGSTHNGSAKMVCSSTNLTTLYIENGSVLVLKAIPVTGQGNIHYNSAAIHARQQILVNDQYPNWEVKIELQVPTARGTWPAFWLNGAWTWPPEADIAEFKGDNKNWQNTFRTSSDVSSIITPVSSAGSWHTYRAWITKASATNVNIHYYIDGAWKGMHTANFVGKPMNLILNLQMEGSSGSPGPTGNTYYRARNVYIGRTVAY
jgi:galactan endo-beta-1,3-galactanase